MTNTAPAPVSEIKEVQMDVPTDQAGGGATRRRRRARRAKTQRGGAAAETAGVSTGESVLVEKAISSAPVAPTAAPAAPIQAGGAKKAAPAATAAPVVVLAPAKKKAKVMLVSKKAIAASGGASAANKTFKAKRIRVTIDNTARTQKRRKQVMRSVESLDETQLREQAVRFGLSRADSVKKVPIDLLRKMLKDYYAMRKGFV